MTSPLIPPSPSRADYARQLEANADPALFAATEPLPVFLAWLAEARASELNDPNAMALSTVDAEGRPDSRMVLLKDVGADGFTFYSNRESAKGVELAGRPEAALLFHWKSLRRQVRVRGPVEPVTAAEADAYFASRARESRIGAWASDQSRPIESREALEARVAEVAARFAHEEPTRPERWTGWRVIPREIEFWRDRPFRLHDRRRFAREGDGWRAERLQP